MSRQSKQSEPRKIAMVTGGSRGIALNIVNPKPLLHLEGAAVLIVSLVGYRWYHGGWIEFVLLFLVPDLSILGYAANARVGAATYNAVHTYVGPLALAGYSVWAGHNSVLLVSLIWMAHIGLDRMLGFGLKYPTRFKDTHLNSDRHALWIADSPLRFVREGGQLALSQRPHQSA
jgi:hypothetical protein